MSAGPDGPAPAADHAARRQRLHERVAALALDGLLLTDPLNVRWASGFTGTNGQLLLRPAGDLLVTDARYEARAAAEAGGLETALRRDPVGVAIERLAADGGGFRLGFEAEHLSWAAGQRLVERATGADGTAVPTTGEVEALRIVKDASELARLERAGAITAEALTWLLDEVVAVGRSERELAHRLEQRFVDLGAEAPAFDTIVAAGPNAAVPHHAPGDRVLAPGDVLTVDAGARVDGYHADCTRTVALGRCDEPLREVHALVERAQAAGREAAVAGATAGDVDAAARGPIDEAGYGERFLHGTGHGVGLAVHEAPSVARGAAATLSAGMTLTVEPGVYLPGVGGVRIEDTVVVTADGPATSLTGLPRGLRVL